MSYIGYIPKKIAYVCPAENMTALYRGYKISQLFEDMDTSEDLIKNIKTDDVLYTYPVDAENPKRIESAKSWASSHYSVDQKKLSVFEIENNLSIIRILDLEIRGEGGRAYKCVSTHGFYFDLREDTLLDIFEHVGMEKGGIVKADFVWASMGAQMKLILKGSDIYKELVESTEVKSLPTIKEYKEGFEYETKRGDRYLYLGEYYGYSFVESGGYYNNYNNHLRYKTGSYGYGSYYSRYSDFNKSNEHDKVKKTKFKLFVQLYNNEPNINMYNILLKPSVFVKEFKSNIDIHKTLNSIKNCVNKNDVYNYINTISYLTLTKDKKDLVLPTADFPQLYEK